MLVVRSEQMQAIAHGMAASPLATDALAVKILERLQEVGVVPTKLRETGPRSRQGFLDRITPDVEAARAVDVISERGIRRFVSFGLQAAPDWHAAPRVQAGLNGAGSEDERLEEAFALVR